MVGWLVRINWNNLDFWFVPFFPNDEARTEQYMEQAGVVGIATWLSFIFGRG